MGTRYDLYDPPVSAEENLELPYFDGYDFVNSTWTFYIRHRFGVWNWLDRFGLVPMTTNRVFLREDGKTVWSDGFYGDWYINPAINYIQIEKHSVEVTVIHSIGEVFECFRFKDGILKRKSEDIGTED